MAAPRGVRSPRPTPPLCSNQLHQPLLCHLHPSPARVVHSAEGSPRAGAAAACCRQVPTLLALQGRGCELLPALAAASPPAGADGSMPHCRHAAPPGTGQARAPRPACTDQPGVSPGQLRAGAGRSKAAGALSPTGTAALVRWHGAAGRALNGGVACTGGARLPKVLEEGHYLAEDEEMPSCSSA